MKVFFFLIIVLVFLAACGLNSNQEKTLNMAIAKYLFAVNSDLKLSRASYTHPSVLKYYKGEGYDEFKKYFSKKNFFWSDAVIGKIEKQESLVQVELKIALKNDEYAMPEKKRISIFALSEDGGSTWFFVEENDYKSQKCGKFQRLIK